MPPASASASASALPAVSESVAATAGVSVKAPATLLADQAQNFVDTVWPALQKAGPAAGAAAIQLDLSALTRFDSSAVAALVALSRRAFSQSVALRYLNVPANLRKLAALYGVDGVLFGN